MSAIIYQGFKVTFATLYPAYSSYKAVKTKNVRDYVKWMMYWIVYAFFVSVEVLADIFVAWIPFYYELKIIFVLWLLSPATKGSSIIYRKLVHPQLAKRETEIDTCIDKASDHGYSTFLALGSRVLHLATNIVLASAIKGQTKLADHLSRSTYGDDVTSDDDNDVTARRVPAGRSDSLCSNESDDVVANEILRESYRREISRDRSHTQPTTPTTPNTTSTTPAAAADKQQTPQDKQDTRNTKQTVLVR